MNHNKRVPDLWPALLALGVFAAALWAQPNALVGVFYDDGLYVVLAKALAEGEGYRFIHLPGAPPGVHYPFLYPALLSMAWRIWPDFPQNVVLLQLLDSAALAVAAWAIASHGRRWHIAASVRYTALVLGFLAFPLLTIVGIRFSESLFLALFASAVMVGDRDTLTTRSAVGAGVLAGLSALTRSVGIAVVVGIPVALWFRGRKRASLVSLAAGLVVVVPWFIWLGLHANQVDPRVASNYGTYLQAAQQGLLGSIISFDLRAIDPLARLILPRVPAVLWYPLAVLLAACVVYGGVVALAWVPALVTSLGFYLVIVSLWNFTPDRFVWIVMPWMALLAANGALSGWRRRKWARIPILVLGLAVAIGYLPQEARSLTGRRFTRTAENISTTLGVIAASIAAETPTEAVIASEDEALIYLYTGRRSVPNYLFRWDGRGTTPLSSDSTAGFFCDAGVTHVAVSGAGAAAAPVVDELAERKDSTIAAVFQVTNGPALYRFRCPG